MLSLYYGFWNYWKLYHKVTFDGPNRLILVNPGETELDVQTDIYSAWKEWILVRPDGENARWPAALATVGGEPTVAGQRLDVTYFLINGWKIKPYPGSYTLNIIGNIFDVDGGEIKVPANVTDVPNNISINTNTSVIVRQVNPQITVEGSGLTDEELATLNNIEATVLDIQNTIIASGSLTEEQNNYLININSNIDSLTASFESGISLSPELTASIYNIEDIVTYISESGALTPSQSAALYNIENVVYQLSSSGITIDTATSASISNIEQTVYDISGSLVTIQSLLMMPFTASLIPSQEQALLDIQTKVMEIWKIHGLDPSNPMAVSKLGRVVDDIDQDFTDDGTTVTVTRNP
jgi:hypothetical protein